MECKNNNKSNAVKLRKKIADYFNKEHVCVSSNLNRRKKLNLTKDQMALKFDSGLDSKYNINFNTHRNSLKSFLDLISHTVPEGDLYLFGGMLRDFALFGRKGFNSDIDIVVDGNLDLAYSQLERFGALRNKFGGLRFMHGETPIDIWEAKKTWAFQKGYVEYVDIKSMLNTTVLNWDAILMNWRSKVFYHKNDYFRDINKRYMDIVLEYNPNPLGMVVRILRHIVLKDAKRVSYAVCNYLSKALSNYTFEDVKYAEFSSYGDTFIHLKLYSAFKEQSLFVEQDSEGIKVEEVKKPMSQLVLP